MNDENDYVVENMELILTEVADALTGIRRGNRSQVIYSLEEIKKRAGMALYCMGVEDE